MALDQNLGGRLLSLTSTDFAMSTVYTWEEVKKHTSVANGLWIVIEGVVYDVTHFLPEHPGGGTLFFSHLWPSIAFSLVL